MYYIPGYVHATIALYLVLNSAWLVFFANAVPNKPDTDGVWGLGMVGIITAFTYLLFLIIPEIR